MLAGAGASLPPPSCSDLHSAASDVRHLPEANMHTAMQPGSICPNWICIITIPIFLTECSAVRLVESTDGSKGRCTSRSLMASAGSQIALKLIDRSAE